MRFLKILVVLLAVTILFCSCKKENVSCEELLAYSLEYGIDGYKDNGSIFLKNAQEGESFFISDKLKKTTYGERFFEALERCEDYAVYVSASTPYEIAIFKCFSRNDTDDILRMCYERADELKVGLRFGKWDEASKNILICEYKNYVVFSFTDSAERNEDIMLGIEKMIKV